MKYVCEKCQKEFATKGSLHRHGKNHEFGRGFRCETCNLRFARHDLLTRHVRIHYGSDVAAGRDRLRSRTACIACRDARAKCSGHRTCERCRERNIDCTFGVKTTGRTSADPALLTVSPSISGSFSMNDSAAEDVTRSGSGRADEQLFADHELPELPMDQPSISPVAITWPWLHEDAFLQTDLSLDFFELPRGDAVYDKRVDLVIDAAAPAGIPTTHKDVGNGNIWQEHSQQRKEQSVESLVLWATRETKGRGAIEAPGTDLVSIGAAVAFAFGLSGGSDCLHRLIRLYEENFWPLWPLVPRFHFQNVQFQPFLRLAMASIGAMYGDKNAATFGVILHNLLRDELIKPFFDHEIANQDSLAVGQARSLIQAAALYFGQRRAFSYAHHIGGSLLAQARRMNLFASVPAVVRDDGRSVDWFDSWIRRESKKRLAIAILRLDMYASVLHGTRPLVSAEELDIELPCSRYLWHTQFATVQAFAAAITQESSNQSQRPLFSDIVRIALDKDEALPRLSTLDQELVFNALQERVWETCAARDSLERLTGCDPYTIASWDTTAADGRATATSVSRVALSLDAHLACRSRKMKSLHTRFSTMKATLDKCHASLNLEASQVTALDRTSLLSCLLVYHLSMIQLLAPLDIIHGICHRSSMSDSKIERIIAWSSSSGASTAQEHSILIYHFLRSEANKDSEHRANVNFLTMIGLYHSAVLLWVLNRARNSRPQQDSVMAVHPAPEPSTEDFLKLYHDINPAWAVRSSFCAAVQQLLTTQPPFARPVR